MGDFAYNELSSKDRDMRSRDLGKRPVAAPRARPRI